MAYTGIDKEIYDSGTHFRPLQKYTQQQWTPPEIMGQNTNAGITNTQASGSYMGYPSYEAWLLAQGGGDGGPDPVDNVNKGGINQNLGPTNITDYEAEAYGVGPTFKGTIARLQDAYSRLPTPGNLIMKGIRHWKTRRAEKKAASKAGKDAADAAAIGQGTNIGGGWTQTNTAGGGATFTGRGGQTHQGFSNTPAGFAAAAESEGSFAQGGRIGLRPGGIVDAGKQYYGKEDWEIQQINKYGVSYPEFLQNQFGKGLHEMDASEIALAVKAWDSWRANQAEGGRVGLYGGGDPADYPENETENIFQIMREQNIPFSEQVEGEGNILEQLIAKYIEEGFPPDQAEAMAMREFEQMALGSDQGIASLV